jgi:glutathionyl-hydroquinone reductase
MYKHKHPWLSGYSFQLNELYSVASDVVNMEILHTAYYSSDNVYENITIPLAWIQDNQLIIDECDKIHKKMDEFEKEQSESVKLAKELTEKVLLAELKAKYE